MERVIRPDALVLQLKLNSLLVRNGCEDYKRLRAFVKKIRLVNLYSPDRYVGTFLHGRMSTS